MPNTAEWRGTAGSLAFHVALVAALSLSLAQHTLPVEPPAIAVEFVDEVGLESVAAVQESALATQATTTEPEKRTTAPTPEPTRHRQRRRRQPGASREVR